MKCMYKLSLHCCTSLPHCVFTFIHLPLNDRQTPGLESLGYKCVSVWDYVMLAGEAVQFEHHPFVISLWHRGVFWRTVGGATWGMSGKQDIICRSWFISAGAPRAWVRHVKRKPGHVTAISSWRRAPSLPPRLFLPNHPITPHPTPAKCARAAGGTFVLVLLACASLVLSVMLSRTLSEQSAHRWRGVHCLSSPLRVVSTVWRHTGWMARVAVNVGSTTDNKALDKKAHTLPAFIRTISLQ